MLTIDGSGRHGLVSRLRPALAFVAMGAATGTLAAGHKLGLPRYYAVYRADRDPVSMTRETTSSRSGTAQPAGYMTCTT